MSTSQLATKTLPDSIWISIAWLIIKSSNPKWLEFYDWDVINASGARENSFVHDIHFKWQSILKFRTQRNSKPLGNCETQTRFGFEMYIGRISYTAQPLWQVSKITQYNTAFATHGIASGALGGCRLNKLQTFAIPGEMKNRCWTNSEVRED